MSTINGNPWKNVQINTDEQIEIESDLLNIGIPGISMTIKIAYSEEAADQTNGPYNSQSKDPVRRGYMALVISWFGRELTTVPASKLMGSTGFAAIKERIETEIDRAKQAIQFELDEAEKKVQQLKNQALQLGINK